MNFYLFFKPLIENLLQGSTERDQQKHTQDFTQRIRNIVSREKLERMCSEYQKKLGYFTKREFVYLEGKTQLLLSGVYFSQNQMINLY